MKWKNTIKYVSKGAATPVTKGNKYFIYYISYTAQGLWEIVETKSIKCKDLVEQQE